MTYGSECWAVKKNDTQKLHTTEMRMLRWARGKTKKDRIKNEDIWREANVEPMTMFLRKKRLRWYGHVLRPSATLKTLFLIFIVLFYYSVEFTEILGHSYYRLSKKKIIEKKILHQVALVEASILIFTVKGKSGQWIHQTYCNLAH